MFYQKTNCRSLKLFSGDLFFPSVISVTKNGTQFKRFLEVIDCDMAMLGASRLTPGNHDVDESEEQTVNELLAGVKTPYLMSTLRRKSTYKLLGNGYLFGVVDVVYDEGTRLVTPEILNRGIVKSLAELEQKPGQVLRIGMIGLMFNSWMEASSLDFVEYKLDGFVSVAKKLTKLLKGRFKCDLVIALTHMSNNEDMTLQNHDTGIDLSRTNFSAGRPRARVLVPQIQQLGGAEKRSQFQNLQ